MCVARGRAKGREWERDGAAVAGGLQQSVETSANDQGNAITTTASALYKRETFN